MAAVAAPPGSCERRGVAAAEGLSVRRPWRSLMAARWAVSEAFWGGKKEDGWMQMAVFHQLLLGPFSNMRSVRDGGGRRQVGEWKGGAGQE